MATCRLSLSAPGRVHGEVSTGNEGRGGLKPILEESARRKKKLEILKCRDSDTEADTVKKILPMRIIGLVMHSVVYTAVVAKV